VQLWVALPDAARQTAPAFEQHRALPVVELEGGNAQVIMGALADTRSPATAFSPIVAAEVTARRGHRLTIPLDHGFEHAVVPLEGEGRIEGHPVAVDTLYYLGCGRREITIAAEGGARALLLGGAPFGEQVLMWWNFVARTTEEIVAAREDWEKGRRFGDVTAYRGARIPAPPFVARPVPRA
jgi:redox-sensitive bicupin YhaK (pirin superfamily)